MSIKFTLHIIGAIILIVFTAATPGVGSGLSYAQELPTPSANVSVVATGLNNPRGLTFGPEGNLYVAEGGTGGTTSTVGQCAQVPAPIGPYTGSPTGSRISKISPSGTVSTVIDALPSSQTQPVPGPLISGVADVAFIGSTLYALEAGAGCSHGVPSVPNGVFRINADGTATLVANLSAFQMAHPVAHPEPEDFEPDGTWYSMVAVGGDLYAIEPNHGELDRIDPQTGQVSRVADISASQGHIVPTALAYHDGAFYVGNLNTFPIQPGSSKILRITPDGQVGVVATGLTTVLGLVFDAQGNMYVAEMSAAAGNPSPGAGLIVQIAPNGATKTIASGLSFPTGLALGPDGQLYVSARGFGLPAGAGRIDRIPVAAACTEAAASCATVPSSGTFSITTMCPFSLTGTGSSQYAGETIYVRSIIAPVSQAGASCTVVINARGSGSPSFAALSTSAARGQWYRFDYTTHAWAQVSSVDQNGTYAFVPA